MESEKPKVFDINLGGSPVEHYIKMNGYNFNLATRIELDSGKEGNATATFRIFMPLNEWTTVEGKLLDKEGVLHDVKLQFGDSRSRAFIDGERVTYLKRFTAVATATTSTHIWISYMVRFENEDKTWHMEDRVLEGNLIPKEVEENEEQKVL